MKRGCSRLVFTLFVCLTLLAEHAWYATPAFGETPCQVNLPVKEERAREILATERPFHPANLDILYSARHPDWRDSAPIDYVDGPALSEESTKEALRAFLERRFSCEPDRVADGINVYTDAIARMKAPEPAMRAALASLVGTIGEPAIDHVLHRSPVSLIHFGAVLERGQALPSRLGIAYDLPDGTRQIVLDRRFRFAPFASFAPILFHEALHTGVDDDAAGLPEEAIASALESLVYMQMLLTDPALARIPDDLTRGANNPMAVARLNSGPPGSSDLTLFVPDSDTQIDPTAVESLTEFYEYYFVRQAPTDDDGFRDRETEGHAMLGEVMALIAEPGVVAQEEPDFDQATLAFVDQNQGALSAAELVAVACILQLELPCE